MVIIHTLRLEFNKKRPKIKKKSCCDEGIACDLLFFKQTNSKHTQLNKSPLNKLRQHWKPKKKNRKTHFKLGIFFGHCMQEMRNVKKYIFICPFQSKFSFATPFDFELDIK